MKKLFFPVLVILMLVLSVSTCLGEDLTAGDYSYIILSDGTAEITDYSGSERKLTIPDMIEGIPVTSLGISSFANQENLTSVTVPDSVVSIGDAAFAEDTSLNTVILPQGLLWMGDLVFQGCTQLEEAVLPAGLVRIGWNPFDRCSLIRSVSFSGKNQFYYVEDGVLYDSRTGTLVTYPSGKTDPDFVIPETITSIGMAAFSENNFLHRIALHENLTDMNGNPFCGCLGLEQIAISLLNPVFEMRSGALFNTRTRELIAYLWGTNASSYSVPSGTVSLAREAFYRHPELTTVRLPKTLITIGDAAFAESGITSIIIPDSVISLGDSTFSACEQLKSVTLPSGLTYIGVSTFYGCSALEDIQLPENLNSIGTAAFMRCTNLKEVTLPENLHYIGNYAFALCTGLEFVDFPAHLYSIGGGAFYGVQNMTASIFPDSLAQEWAVANGVTYTLKNVQYLDNDAI